MPLPRPHRRAPPTEAVIYVRVSTERQKNSGLGADAQEFACREYAQRQGWAVVEVYRDEGMSGMLPPRRRPGLKRALEATGLNGHRVLLVYSLSRFCRNQRDFWTLVDNPQLPVPLVSATEPFELASATGRLIAGVMSVVNQFESDISCERTRGALAAAARAGKKHCLSLETAVPESVKRAQELRAAGLTQRAIMKQLNRENVPTARGGRWQLSTVQTALRTRVPEQRPATHDEIVAAYREAGTRAGAAGLLGLDEGEIARRVAADAGLRARVVAAVAGRQ